MRIIEIKNKLFAKITVIPEILNQPYYPFLDGLRAIAIITVILCHVLRYSQWLNFVDGTIGVHLFFIISGFLITTLLLKEKVKRGNVSLKNFYIRRVLRIFPVAYLYLIVLLVLNVLFKLGITAQSFVGAALYVRNLPVASDWYTGHFWTLSIEEQFYLFAPIVLVSNTERYIKLMLMLFIAVPVISYLGYNNVGVFYTNRAIHVFTFVLLAILDQGALYILSGSLLSILIFKGVINTRLFQGKYYLSFILFITAFIVHFPFTQNGLILYLSAISFTILMMLVIVLNLNQSNFLSRLLSNRYLVKTGILSYSLYIWQELFTCNQPWAKWFKYADSAILNLPVLFIVAYLSYAFYESWFLKQKKRFAR